MKPDARLMAAIMLAIDLYIQTEQREPSLPKSALQKEKPGK
jgi:hypothetical protein